MCSLRPERWKVSFAPPPRWHFDIFLPSEYWHFGSVRAGREDWVTWTYSNYPGISTGRTSPTRKHGSSSNGYRFKPAHINNCKMYIPVHLHIPLHRSTRTIAWHDTPSLINFYTLHIFYTLCQPAILSHLLNIAHFMNLIRFVNLLPCANLLLFAH